ncbi:ABC transporter substrate-binding protein [Methylomonas methanica]|uniref:ABC transporter, substrate binding protein, PQQ-dependent alcohol dehydrogenase system n=1 Tax=Methylomonas methanica (strain DSM 25384 / MC09) TaxID=857087 RepID=G0A7F1_METMM|nr:ABC transporter substrate-binding protein [Methylomonas methanica]AEG00621.1 ABC transporter, substrate binding protein, PQQ-dependent alcohol dehydrogenase system [Methylomonas methanica MC09]
MSQKNQYFLGLVLLFTVINAIAADKQSIKIAYISQERAVPAALSNLDTFIQNKGQLGAELAVGDNNTTGQFTQQQYELKEILVPVGGDIVQAFNSVGDDTGLVVLNVNPAQVNQLADLPAAQNKLLFDAATRDDELRGAQCRHHVLHILPSRAMRADALAQYMLIKRWREWFLVIGQTTEDQLYAAAIKRAAKRYGMKLVAEKAWDNTYDARRTAQSDVPQFTQGEDYDVLVVADEQGLFGEYLDYRTWLPRPVIGTQGLIATAWHRTHEQWGAVQLQNRFKEQAGRWMEEEDYAAYLAVRAIGEASVRAKSNQVQAIKDYMLSDAFALQGYKGRPLSFRSWDGQLRQPILLAAPRSMVSVAPLDGFLHPNSELDTLGYDQPETACK